MSQKQPHVGSDEQLEAENRRRQALMSTNPIVAAALAAAAAEKAKATVLDDALRCTACQDLCNNPVTVRQ